MLFDNHTTYYVSDNLKNKIYLLNDDWSYVNQASFNQPAYMLTVDKNIYIAANENIFKTDKNLNILKQYNHSGFIPSYRGIYHNSTNNLLFVTAASLQLIHVFDLNLSFIHDSISTPSHTPRSITGFKNSLYVGVAYGGIILVIVNKHIKSIIYACNGEALTITSIVYDSINYMATACETQIGRYIYLYHLNGSYTQKSFPTLANTEYIGFDSKNNLVIISQLQINIYSLFQ